MGFSSMISTIVGHKLLRRESFSAGKFTDKIEQFQISNHQRANGVNLYEKVVGTN
jgi:hypothetical protein